MDRTLLKYAEAGPFLRRLRDAIKLRQVTRQEALTLKGQAMRGDVDGAEKGLAKILRRSY